MQPTKRKHESGVIEQLLKQPHRFAFAQLLNLLLRDLRRQGITYERAFSEVLSFRNSLSLSFPPSEVAALDVETAAPDGASALHGKRIRITPAFIGLLGISGTLPLHDTERIAARRAHDKDNSQCDLVDIFSNRLIGLFYAAWGKYRVEHGMDIRGKDSLLPMLTALAGVQPASVRGSERPAGRVRPETAAYFAGLLRTRPVSASTVEQVLCAYLDVPVRLEQFVGCWAPVPENRRSTLGVTTPALGVSAALGARQWRHDLSARLHIGPLDERQIARFLPGGSALAALEEMVALFAVPRVRYEVRLLLAPACIKPFTLTTRTASPQLGWSTFLTGTPGVASRADIRSMLHLPVRASPGPAHMPGLG